MTDELLAQADRIILPGVEALAVLKEHPSRGGAIALQLPRLCFGREEQLRDEIDRFAALGGRWVYAPTVDALSIAARHKTLRVMAGFTLNLMNRQAILQAGQLGASEATVSFELHQKPLRTLLEQAPLPSGMVVYGHLPLMVSRICPMSNSSTCPDDCERCAQEAWQPVTDRKGAFFYCRDHTLINGVPLYIGDWPIPPEASHQLFYFTKETAEECVKVLALHQRKAPYPGRFTRGLYAKGVL